ncbi:Protein neuralized, partial [Mucuna pruriens]
MEQLYHEIAELRKSIKGCMDMQMQLQQSMNPDANTVKKEKKKEKKSHNRVPKKGNCCICYEMKVDSLLYRCGHMCTCLKCANELQWNSGKCPICRAKIVDVVRVYVHG